jgi:sarcosine oxidase subunit delta
MLLICCPHCGPRAEIEFSYGGEAHIARPVDPMSLDDETWTKFLYVRSNRKGMHYERWRHIHGCGRFFNAQRDTMSDMIAATYSTGEQPPALAKKEAAQ